MVVRRLLAALLFLPVLASCSDDDPDSSDTGDPTTPVTTSPTPTETPPPEPAEAGDRTKAGAKAFVEYWVETLNYAAASGDSAGLRRIGTETCESCSEIADVIDGVYQDGGRIEGEGWEITALPSSVLTQGAAEVKAVLILNPQVIHYGDGSSPDRNPGLRNATARFELEWTGQTWRLQEMYQGPA